MRTYRPKQFCEHFGLGLTKFYAEIAAGRLRARKIGRSTVILAEDAEAWLNSLPDLETI